MVWPLSPSLAATKEIDLFFLFLRVLRCFSSRVPSVRLWIHLTVTEHYFRRVSPFGYPRFLCLLAAPRGFSQLATVLLRRMVPWHPPCALISLIFSSLRPETNCFLLCVHYRFRSCPLLATGLSVQIFLLCSCQGARPFSFRFTVRF